MPRAIFTNNARTILAAGITGAATTITVVDGSVFPSPSGGDWAYLTLEHGSDIEIVKLTSRSGNTLTVQRGQDGTSAVAFSEATVSLRITKAVLDEIHAGIAAAALTAAWDDITGKPSTFTPSTHTHAVADVTGLQAALDGKANLSGATFTGAVTFPGNVKIGDSYQAGVIGYTDSNWGFIFRPPVAGAIAAHRWDKFDGTELMRLTEAGTLTLPGVLNISDGAANDRVSINFSSGLRIFNKDNTPIYFGTTNTERMRITATGLVGIGTTNPTKKLSVEGNMVIRDSSPTIYFRDTDHRSAMIHVNSNVFYVLRGDGTDSENWSTVNGQWPLMISLEDLTATLGGRLDVWTGTVGTQVGIQRFGWSNGVQRYQWALEANAELTMYTYDSAGSYLGKSLVIANNRRIGIGKSPRSELEITCGANQNLLIIGDTNGSEAGRVGIVAINDANSGYTPIGYLGSNHRFWGKTGFNAAPSNPEVTIQQVGSNTIGEGGGGAQTCIEVRGNGTGAAAMTFHRPGAWAAYFGLDTDNRFKVGGWSYGAASYPIAIMAGPGAVSGNITWGTAAPGTLAVGEIYLRYS